MSNPQEIFTTYYKTNHWGSPESRSGKGSTLAYTKNIREQLPKLLHRLFVRTFVDVPCGDFNWMSRVDLPKGVQYIGGDIVPEMVEYVRKRYHHVTNASFQFVDIIAGDIPHGDMLMCRDCLFHFSNKDIRRALCNFMESETTWLLTSTHPKTQKNVEIETGQFAPLNLLIAPWGFGPARWFTPDWIEPFPQRYMALWHRDDVAEVLKRRV